MTKFVPTNARAQLLHVEDLLKRKGWTLHLFLFFSFLSYTLN